MSSLPRVLHVAMALLVLLLWRGTGTLFAQQSPTKVVLDNPTFSNTDYTELQQLANRVAATVDDLIPGHMSELVRDDIICFETTDKTLGKIDDQIHPPITISSNYKLPYEPTTTIVGRTRIALFEVEPSEAVSYQGRFVYQLAHELAHVKMGVRIDNYLVETLAVAVSHEVLVRLGLLAYANLAFNEELHKLPYDIQLAYAEKKIPELQHYWQSQIPHETTLADRPFQTLGAALIRLNVVPYPALLGVAFDADCPLDNPPINARSCAPNLKKMRTINPVLTSLGYAVQ